VASVFFNRSGVFGSFRSNFEGAISAMLDIANFRIVHVFGRDEAGSTFPYWSLSLEEQFYFLLPLVVLAAGKRLPWVLAVAVVGQTFLTRSGAGATRFELLLNQLRSDALLLGVLIAIWSRRPSWRLFEPTALADHPGAGFALMSLLLVALAAMGSGHLNIVSFQFGVVAVVAALLVWLASYDRNYLCPDIGLKRLLVWVGSRSYALYLVHIPAYFASRELWFRLESPGTIFGPAYFWRLGLTALVLTLIMVELNYRFVEVPLRRRGARIAERVAGRGLS
jgi:peptidoglycan/LPS O-acetylase OafA/YrhL